MEKPTLRPYQIEDLAFLIGNKRCGLLHSPGCGKTPPVCVYLWYVWSEEKARSFWVMPKSLMKKNKDELLRFSHFKPEDIAIVDGTPKQIETALSTDPKVLILGFERFRRSWEDLKARFPDLRCLVGDEWHMGFGSNGSKRTQALYKCSKKLDRLVAMTGTIITGRLDSAYPLIHLVEPRYYTSYAAFVNMHAMKDWWGTIYDWTGHERISEILQRHTKRRSFEEVYGKEAKIIVREPVEMSKKQREAYDEFHAKAMLELEDDFLDGTVPGVAVIRARQIMAHPETFGIAEGEKTGKDERLEVHLADAWNDRKPLLIFAVHKAEQERIYNRVQEIGFTAGLINGDVPTPQRVKIDEGFRNGSIQVVVASPKTAAFGFNWEHVDHVIFVSMDYNDDSFFQAYRRAIRGQREKPLLITVLEYEDSIDQRVFAIVEHKSAMANKVDNTQEAIKLTG